LSVLRGAPMSIRKVLRGARVDALKSLKLALQIPHVSGEAHFECGGCCHRVFSPNGNPPGLCRKVLQSGKELIFRWCACTIAFT
jgi:hypothetical protein